MLNRLLERLKPWSCTVQTTMRLTTRSCRLGGTISARMKRWQLSRSTVGCVIGLPAFGLCGVESARDGRRHHRTVCRLSRQSNSDKTHLATDCLIPSIFYFWMPLNDLFDDIDHQMSAYRLLQPSESCRAPQP